MKRLIFAVLLAALLAGAAVGRYNNGADHVGVSGTVDNTDLGNFSWFSVINDGANKATLQFYYGPGGGTLQGSAWTIPAGASWGRKLGRTATGYRLVAAGVTDIYTQYE